MDQHLSAAGDRHEFEQGMNVVEAAPIWRDPIDGIAYLQTIGPVR